MLEDGQAQNWETQPLSLPMPIALPFNAWTAPSPRSLLIHNRRDSPVMNVVGRRITSRATSRRQVLDPWVEVIIQNVVVRFNILQPSLDTLSPNGFPCNVVYVV